MLRFSGIASFLGALCGIALETDLFHMIGMEQVHRPCQSGQINVDRNEGK